MEVMIRHLQRGEPVPEETAEWFVNGYDGFLGGQELLTALGLTRRARTQWLDLQRDRRLQDAFKALQTSNPAATAADFAQRISEFREFIWKAATHHTEPDGHWDMVDIWLFYAFEFGRPVPTTVRNLRQVLGCKVPDFTSAQSCNGAASVSVSAHS